MAIVSTTEDDFDVLEAVMAVHRIVIDLHSMSHLIEDEEQKNFVQIVEVLTDRDFQVLLVTEHDDLFPEWRQRKDIGFLKLESEDNSGFLQNDALFQPDVFWITESPLIQNRLTERKQLFAYGSEQTEGIHGVHYQYFRDLLELFHPSQHTSILLGEKILEIKRKSPKQPLIVAVGGPDQCGHAYFMGPLVEELEKSEFLIEGLDLTEIMGTEFQSSQYWRSQQAKRWIMDQLLLPFSEGQRVFIEDPPVWIVPYETSPFPLFWTPEMILLVWGTTLFLPEIQDLSDWNILLELSPRVATARLFGIDERENFNPEFVQKYESADGKLYQNYLEKFEVQEVIDQRIRFDNFHAFRMTE